MNTVSAFASVAGTALGLLIGESSEDAVLHCLPVVAGQFLFIALSHLLPELLEQKKSKTLMAALFSICCGAGLIALMLAVPLGGH